MNKISRTRHTCSESWCKMVPYGPWWQNRCNMCPDFFPGCCLGSHCCSHNASILTCICTMWPSRTWSMDVGMFHRPLLRTATHHQYIVPNMCSNLSICPSSFPWAYNATLFKWLKLFSRSMYSSERHGCTLELMFQTLFTSESTTVTACRVKTESAKTGHRSAIWSPWPWQLNL